MQGTALKTKKQKQNLFVMEKKKVETRHPVYCYCQMYSFSLLLFHTLVSGFPSFLSKVYLEATES